MTPVLLTSPSASAALSSGRWHVARIMLICLLCFKKLLDPIYQYISVVFLSTHKTFAMEDGNLNGPLALTLMCYVYYSTSHLRGSLWAGPVDGDSSDW